MGFLKNIFKGKEQPIQSYGEFWEWFQKNERDFFKIVNDHKNIEKNFFDKISPKLAELKDGYYCVTGMFDDNAAELIVTADGQTKNVVFVEELINAAPKITGWKFTALKPALNIKDVNIRMNGYDFKSANLNFYANELPEYPDEIDISVAHDDYTDDNKDKIVSGIYIFLDNYLGELDFINNIDNIDFIEKKEAKQELIPIIKLKDYLIWRQKEFIEKYEGERYVTEDDNCSIFEAEQKSGNALIAAINTDLLKWDKKASHPWIAQLTFKYDGSKNYGMPNEKDYELLDKIEEEIITELKDYDGYLNIGRQTADGEREVYFACKDFRKPSKLFYNIQKTYSGSFEITYDVYKDKYWQSFERFDTSSSSEYDEDDDDE